MSNKRARMRERARNCANVAVKIADKLNPEGQEPPMGEALEAYENLVLISEALRELAAATLTLCDVSEDSEP